MLNYDFSKSAPVLELNNTRFNFANFCDKHKKKKTIKIIIWSKSSHFLVNIYMKLTADREKLNSRLFKHMK